MKVMRIVRKLFMTVLVCVPFFVVACARDAHVYKKTRASTLAMTAEQKTLALAQERLEGKPLEQLGRWLARRKGDPARIGCSSCGSS